MTKTKLIIEINEEILNNPYNFPEYVFKKAVLNGKPLQTEFEKIKAEIRERANECQDYQTYINGLMYTQTYINGLMYTYTIIDKYISELKGEQK